MRISSIILCLGLSACAVVPEAVGRKQAPTVNAKPEVIVQTPAEVRRAVQNFVAVVDTLAPVAEAACRARAPQINCDFRIVVDDRQGAPINAFQTLDEDGHPVIVFTVPLIAVARNRDELAFIMAHEAAHHILNHLAQQQRNAMVAASVFGGIAGVFSGRADEESVRAARQLGAAIGARTYSKGFELEADALGTLITQQAGYDAVLGAAFFSRLPDPGNQFLGTHPANADRISIVRRVASRL